MQRHIEHVRTRVEDVLRAVAVVKVDVQNCDAICAAVAQILRRDRRVVEKTIAAVQIARRVMARRTA